MSKAQPENEARSTSFSIFSGAFLSYVSVRVGLFRIINRSSKGGWGGGVMRVLRLHGFGRGGEIWDRVVGSGPQNPRGYNL